MIDTDALTATLAKLNDQPRGFWIGRNVREMAKECGVTVSVKPSLFYSSARVRRMLTSKED